MFVEALFSFAAIKLSAIEIRAICRNASVRRHQLYLQKPVAIGLPRTMIRGHFNEGGFSPSPPRAANYRCLIK
jgi:hypothetical protein